jgi:hypothetical protein
LRRVGPVQNRSNFVLDGKLGQAGGRAGRTTADLLWIVRCRAGLLLVLAGLVAGCGAPAATTTPEGTLSALAAAVSADDPAAVDRLLCPAGRAVGHTMQQVRDGLTELDPTFTGAGWHADAGPITERTAENATGSLIVTRTGWPADVPPLVEDFLAANQVPRPMNELGDGGEITLVLQDGHWLACGPRGLG